MSATKLAVAYACAAIIHNGLASTKSSYNSSNSEEGWVVGA